MKKNRMMRLASVLLVLTLLSTSVISGTFAKYVTSDTASDTARVAKFGVVVSASGSLFGKDYVQKDDGNTPGSAGLTVKSSNTDKLVAPGTKSSDAGLTFAVTGTPEVKVEVKVAVTDVKDVFLRAKTGLPNMTTGNATDMFDNGADYYPVKYTLTQTTTGGTNILVAGKTLTEVQSALTGLSTTYDANTNLADAVGTLKLTWEWDFDNSGAGTYDRQDTLLGDLAAGIILAPAPDPVLVEGTDYNLQTGLTISITVTQVD